MNLTIEEQKILTDWLGECPHKITLQWFQSHGHDSYQNEVCDLCGAVGTSIVHLDFTNDRVIFRLIEKCKYFLLSRQTTGKWLCAVGEDHPRFVSKYYATEDNLQLAICKAILAYLEDHKQ